MATDYGAVASDVGERVPYRTIDATSQPSTATVNGWLEVAEAKINNALKSGSITTPITDAEGIEQLQSLSIDYAEGRVRRAYAATGGDGTNDDGIDLIDGFELVVKDMRIDPVGWAAALTGGSAPASSRRMRGTATDDVDDRSIADLAPTFVRTDAENQF